MKILLLVLILVLGGCAPKRDCAGGRFQELPITMVMDSAEETMFIEATKLAMDAWRDQTGVEVFKLVTKPNQGVPPTTVDGVNSIHVYRTIPSNFGSNKQAVATVYFTPQKLYVEGDILINADTFRYYTGDVPNTLSRVNLESLMLHELGHVLGIENHSEEPESVMRAELANGHYRMKLSAKDLSDFQCLYGN